MRFGLLKVQRGSALSLRDRAQWLGVGSGNILRRIGLRYEVRGAPPVGGLIASNHLSHLDILCYAAAYRCIFVSKYEVMDWPIFGWFARWGGTIFVHRERAADAVTAGRAVEAALAAGAPVMLFPEGTSTDGAALLPFHPLLFEPAVRGAVPVTASAISYRSSEAQESVLCYYGDVAFAPHLLTCLGLDQVEATMAAEPPEIYSSRKAAAAATEAQVAALRARMRAERQPQ